MKRITAFIRWVQVILLEIKFHVPAFVVILLFYLLFWNFPQTSDLQLILNQDGRHYIQVPLFFASLVVIAFLISNVNDVIDNFSKLKWKSLQALDPKEEVFIPAYKSGNNNPVYPEGSRKYVKRMFPKVLGTLFLLVVAFSVENAYYDINKDTFLIGSGRGLFVAIILLLISLNKYLSITIRGLMQQWKIRHSLPIILVIIGLLIVAFYGFRSAGGSEADIRRLFWSLIILALMFFIVSTSYSKYILGFKEQYGAKIIIALTILSFGAYVALLFYPMIFTNRFNSLSIINICIIGLFSMANTIKLIGKSKKVPLLSVVLVILTILGFITASRENFRLYDLSAIPTENNKVSQRNSLNRHIKSWINERRELIENYPDKQKFKVLFISSEGGGSRAGLWSFLVHSYLYERNPDYFDVHTFSMTGASGGSVGNVMFYNVANYNLYNSDTISLLSEAKDKEIFKYKASSVYQNDFLSTSVAALLGRDFIASIAGFNLEKDRGALLESEWETSYQKIFNNPELSLEKEFLSMPIQKEKKTAPLLLVNTVNVQKGEYSVISPVTFLENKKSIGVFDDFLADFDCVRPEEGIKKSSAMSITARFPYVSPVARVEKVGQFMDAGYYDNIGGTVTRRLAEVFNEVLRDTCYTQELRDKIELVFMVIANHEDKKIPDSCELKKEKKKFPYAPQIIAPLKGVLNATFAQKEEMEKTFGSEYIFESKSMAVTLDSLQESFYLNKEDPITPTLPLGRFLSKAVIRSLENNLNGDLKVRLDTLVPNKSK